MKKSIFFILPLVLILFFAGCASNQLESNSEAGISSSSNKENKQDKEKLRYEDWKYKGFGYDLPEWVEPALDNKISKVEKILPELKDSTVLIISGRGINLDQAEASAKEKAAESLAENLQSYILYDNYWVKECGELENPYISVYIYYLK